MPRKTAEKKEEMLPKKERNPHEKVFLDTTSSGLSAERTKQGNRVPLGREADRKVEPKDIAHELAETVGEQPRTFIPLRRDAVDMLQRHYPLVRNVDDLKNAPQTMKKSEFGFCPLFCPNLVDDTCQHGLFPMSIDFGHSTYLFTPKCHKERAITFLPSWEPPKGASKLAKRCTIGVNRPEDYPAVAQMIYDQHGENWLCAALRRCYYNMFCNPSEFKTKIMCIAIRLKKKYLDDDDEDSNKDTEQKDATLEDDGEGELVSCELGYVVGDIYASFTGAYTMHGAGTLQLAVTGLLMKQLGMRVWDLGMAMKYKEEALGAEEVPRKRWLDLVEKRKLAVQQSEAGEQKVDVEAVREAEARAPLTTFAAIAAAPVILTTKWLQEHGQSFEASLLYSYRVPEEPALQPTTGDAATEQTMSKSQLKKLKKREFLELRKKGQADAAPPRGTKMKADVEA